MMKQQHHILSYILLIFCLSSRPILLHSLRLGQGISSMSKTFAKARPRRRDIIAKTLSKVHRSDTSSIRLKAFRRNGKDQVKRRLGEMRYRVSDTDEENENNIFPKQEFSNSVGEMLPKRIRWEGINTSFKVDGIKVDNESVLLEESLQNENKIVRNVHDLRKAILHNGYKLEDIELDSVYGNEETSSESIDDKLNITSILNHDVLKLIEHRVQTNSKPGSRNTNDTAVLALSIEGGGMRGAVSAGMAAAIATLGLCDAFDSIYGSSAGSVVGAYMISRQMCVDVYTDVLPVARKRFVSKMRLVSSLIVSLVDDMLTTTSLRNFDLISKQTPAMNISFVLDGIMDPESGLRPLDFESFQANDKKQSLRVVSSAVQNGEMKTFCFGSNENDFFEDDLKNPNSDSTTFSTNRARRGLFACLEASMTVPGATGPPVELIRGNKKDSDQDVANACFDAFCFEPLPYRSAVEEGATHVLVLRSRSEGCHVKTKPGMYEKTVAPIYFKSNGFPQVAKYFEKGGQQYRYLEDVMTLDDGRNNMIKNPDDANSMGVPVPPTEIYYGSSSIPSEKTVDISKWKRAHLLPVAVPSHKEELSTLGNGEDEVLQAVRDGFSAAFELLAPSAGLELDASLTGDRVAELVFPKRELLETILNDPILVKGDAISEEQEFILTNSENRGLRKRDKLKLWLKKSILKKNSIKMEKNESFSTKLSQNGEMLSSTKNTLTDPVAQQLQTSENNDATKLLSCLPGIQAGKLASLATGLHLSART